MTILAIPQAPGPVRATPAGPARYLQQLRRYLPTVTAGPLGYRPLAMDDYWRLWLATRDPAFNRCLPWPAPDAPEGALERVRAVLAEQEAGQSIAFACETADSQRRWSAIFRFTAWRDGLETGLWLHPESWGKGYGTGIIAAAIDAAFEVTDAPAIYSKTSADNIGACRITTRCGMTAIGPASAPDGRGGTLVGIEWKISREHAALRALGVAVDALSG